ncbi:MAG: hypothetical protein KIT00_04115 [Rhodospirillales bacterium]|nr:hypothetical protein [Rhodospirillales bacterium]
MHVGVIGNSTRSERTRDKKTAASNSNRFSQALMGITNGDHDTASSVHASGSVAGLLSVQEAANATDEKSRRRVVQHGENILEQLEQLRRDVLTGNVSPDRLATLSQTLRARSEATEDPLLQEIIDEIELRAAIELAKWESRR